MLFLDRRVQARTFFFDEVDPEARRTAFEEAEAEAAGCHACRWASWKIVLVVRPVKYNAVKYSEV